MRTWLHSDFLNVSGEEMHKSVGNVVTLRQLTEKGWKPRAIRLFLIGAHYRDKLDLTDESLQQAKSNIARIDAFSSRLRDAKVTDDGPGGVGFSSSFLAEFEGAMDDDLNVAEALAALYGFLRTINTLIDSGGLSRPGRDAVVEALRKVDSVLGVLDREVDPGIADHVLSLIREREEARRRRDYKRADEIRTQLKIEGITLEDRLGGGVSWKVE